jgi:hypothetical protein
MISCSDSNLATFSIPNRWRFADNEPTSGLLVTVQLSQRLGILPGFLIVLDHVSKTVAESVLISGRT